MTSSGGVPPAGTGATTTSWPAPGPWAEERAVWSPVDPAGAGASATTRRVEAPDWDLRVVIPAGAVRVPEARMPPAKSIIPLDADEAEGAVREADSASHLPEEEWTGPEVLAEA
ncbi:MAG: hypothetical protein ACRDI0_02330 [Actinomycetota bacterium]